MQPSTSLPAEQGCLSMHQCVLPRSSGSSRAATCPALLPLCGPRAAWEASSCMAARVEATPYTPYECGESFEVNFSSACSSAKRERRFHPTATQHRGCEQLCPGQGR